MKDGIRGNPKDIKGAHKLSDVKPKLAIKAGFSGLKTSKKPFTPGAGLRTFLVYKPGRAEKRGAGRKKSTFKKQTSFAK